MHELSFSFQFQQFLDLWIRIHCLDNTTNSRFFRFHTRSYMPDSNAFIAAKPTRLKEHSDMYRSRIPSLVRQFVVPQFSPFYSSRFITCLTHCILWESHCLSVDHKNICVHSFSCVIHNLFLLPNVCSPIPQFLLRDPVPCPYTVSTMWS